MTKKTFGKIMPRQVSKSLTIMGEQIMLARKRRHLSMQDVTDRATITLAHCRRWSLETLRFRWVSMPVCCLLSTWRMI
jgi:hypothetical protein